MAHQIRENDRFGEVRSNGKRAWHGLGIEIPDGLSAVDGAKRIGLGWDTELLPVYADRLLQDGMQRIESPDHRLHVRADTGDVLGMVSSSYKKWDNQELFEFADAVLGEDHAGVLETAGSLYGGRRVFALIRLPQVIVAGGDDITKCYLCLSNGHGGFAAAQGGATGVRVVCANTMALADHEIGASGFRFIHTGDIRDKLKTAQMLLGFARKQIDRVGEQVKALAHTQVTAQQVSEFMHAAFEAAFPRPERDEELLSQWEQKQTEAIGDWLVLFDNERNNGMAAIRGSAWAMLNAVTEWHDHERGRTGSDSGVRIHSNLFGASRIAKQKAMKLALAMV